MCDGRKTNFTVFSVLGTGVPGLDVSDPGFDIDAAIDASAAADPSITGTAGKKNVCGARGVFILNSFRGKMAHQINNTQTMLSSHHYEVHFLPAANHLSRPVMTQKLVTRYT